VKRESITGPLVLIAIGSFFLLKRWVPDFHPFEIVREWWPALLIIVGAVMLAQRLAGGRVR
jgi:hypothetical protein